MMKNNDAVVLFSGGLDSTTALYWAKNEFARVYALAVYYGQRHRLELEMAQKTAAALQIDFHPIDLPLDRVVFSALTDEDREIPGSLETSRDESGLPHTYVPFRNGIFLSLAAAFGESRGAFDIVTGFNLIDTPDYPDTTKEFTAAMEEAVNRGTGAALTGKRFRIHTPLIDKSKKEIIEAGLGLGVDYSYSLSCYRGEEMPCLRCPSCDIRSRAFKELNMEDPLITRLKKR